MRDRKKGKEERGVLRHFSQGTCPGTHDQNHLSSKILCARVMPFLVWVARYSTEHHLITLYPATGVINQRVLLTTMQNVQKVLN